MTLPFPLRKACLALTLSAGLLAGCSPVPMATLAELHDFDLSTVDAGAVRFAVRVPDFMELEGGAPVVTLSVGLNGAAPELREYRLTAEVIAAEAAALAPFSKSGAVVQSFALDPQSARDLNAYLEELRRTAAPGSRQLSLAVGASGCRNDGGSGRVPMTTFIRLGPGEPYLVLTRQRDIDRLARSAGAETGVRACG